MNKLAHSLERKAFSAAVDYSLSKGRKEREKGFLQILELTKRFMGDNFMDSSYEGARRMIEDPDSKWMQYANRLLDEVHPHVAKMTALNMGFEAAFYGTKTHEVNDLRRGEGVFEKVMKAMELLKAYGLIFGTSICYTRNNVETVTSDEFLDMIIEKGCRYAWYFHYMPVGNDASVEFLPTAEQRVYMYHRIREIRGLEGGKQIFTFNFQNDGEYVGGCIAGGRNYFHINANGDVEPCVFIHYSGANIREHTLLEALKQPLFMQYYNNQPFNGNHLRPCPMLENPGILKRMVQESGAVSTDLKSPETAEHLCGKCEEYAAVWGAAADKIWEEHPRKSQGYVNYRNEEGTERKHMEAYDKRTKTIGKVFFVVVLLAAICYTFRDSAVPIGRQLMKTAPAVLTGICLSSVVYHMIEGWVIFSFAREYCPAFRYSWSVGCAFYCSFYRVATLGSGAGVAAVYYLDKHGMPADQGTGMYMLRYVVHKVSIVIFSGLFYLLDFRFMQEHFRENNRWLLAGYGLTIVICIMLVLVVCSARFHRLLLFLLKKCNRRGRFTDKIQQAETYFGGLKQESVRLLKRRSLIVRSVLKDLVKLAFWYGIPWLLLWGSGTLTLMDSLAVTSMAVMLAAVIPTPAGIGSVEVFLVAFLATVTDMGQAGAVALLYRFATFLFPFVVGGITAILWRRRKEL